jgi:hypothetical protein
MNERPTLNDPARFAHSIVVRGEAWADAQHAADVLESTVETLLASIIKEHFDKPEWKARALAKSDGRYVDHVSAWIDAKRAATIARVRYDGAKAMGEFARSAESTRRAEMQIGSSR